MACSVDEGHGAIPAPALDPLRVIGRAAERLPPWFHEHQAIGPGPLRQTYLNVMRRLSSAPPLSDSTRNETRGATQRRECDTLVVGGGMSGLAAAAALADAGRRVLLLEAHALGGTALVRPTEQAAAAAAIARVRARVECIERTLCAGLYEAPRRALAVGPTGNLAIHYRELVVATGAYDRLPTVPGNDLPGIVGVRGFERLAASCAILAPMRVGVYGATIEAGRALAAASDSGIALEFIAGPGELPNTAVRRFPGTRLAAVLGSGGVRGVVLAGRGEIACDLLVAAFSQPGYELQAQNGASIKMKGEPPVVWAVAGGRAPMLAVGEAAGWFDREGSADRTAAAVAQWLVGRLPDAPEWTQRPAERITPEGAAFVCLCEDVRVRDIRAAIADGYRDIELVKRHTGAATGPCQGKLCHGALLGCAAEAGLELRIPTPRPLVRPVPIAQLAGPVASAASVGAPE